MAGKPDDIPKGVWDGAENTLDTMLSNHGYKGWRDDSIATIARAVMAAAAAERQGCAHEAEIVRHPRGTSNETADWLAGTCAAADAIRKRGEA